jgi:hypothetical protein
MHADVDGARHLEVAQLWGGTLLELRRFREGEAVTIGSAQGSHFAVDDPRVGPRFTLVPSGSGELQAPGEAPAQRISTRPTRVTVGALQFQARWVAGVPRAAADWARVDYRFPKVLAILLLLAASTLFVLREGQGAGELGVDDLRRNAVAISRILTAVRPPPKVAPADRPAPSAPKHRGDEGAASRLTRPHPERQDMASLRQRDLDKVKRVGVLGALATLGHAADQVLGAGPSGSITAALDGLRAGNAAVGDAHGLNGLGSRGTGPGGGGSSDHFGIGGVGTHDGRGPGGDGEIGLNATHKKATVIPPHDPSVVGSLSREEIERVIKRHQSEILYCYNSELQKDPSLQGKLSVSFTIAGSGAVSEAVVLQDGLENVPLEACVLARIQRWRFPEPKGGGEVVVSYPWIFTQAGGE